MTHLVRLLAATVLLTVGCTADYIAQQLYTDSACATTPFVSAFQLGGCNDIDRNFYATISCVNSTSANFTFFGSDNTCSGTPLTSVPAQAPLFGCSTQSSMPTYWASYLCVAGEMPPDPAHAFVQATYLNPMGCTATPNVYMKATYIVDVCSSGGTGGMLSSCNATGFTFSTWLSSSTCSGDADMSDTGSLGCFNTTSSSTPKLRNLEVPVISYVRPSDGITVAVKEPTNANVTRVCL